MEGKKAIPALWFFMNHSEFHLFYFYSRILLAVYKGINNLKLFTGFYGSKYYDTMNKQNKLNRK